MNFFNCHTRMLRIFIGIALFSLQVHAQEVSQQRPISYIDLIPYDVRNDLLKEWQSYSIAQDKILSSEVILRECVKTDNPYLAHIAYFLYKDKAAQACSLLNTYLTLAVTASEEGSVEALEYILKIKGVNPDAADSSYYYAYPPEGGDTAYAYPDINPLIRAAGSNKTKCVSLLLRAKADVNKIFEGQSALQSAIIGNAIDVVKLLVNDPSIILKNRGYLHAACCNGSTKIAKLLIEKEPSLLNEENEWGQTPFFNAIEVSASEDGAACMLPFFLQFIDKIDINHKTKNQSYPLLAAAETGSPEALQMLLNLPGIDIQCHNSGGMDVLQVAAWYNNKKKVQLLLDRSDIDPLKVTNRGKTAYDLTIEPEIKAMIRDAIAKRGSQATITHEKNS